MHSSLSELDFDFFDVFFRHLLWADVALELLSVCACDATQGLSTDHVAASK